jgi:ribosome-associated toxin RatA of RatAB toxin-antitoxin module
MLGGLAWQLVRARPDVVYQALTNVPAYPQLLPAVESARLLPDEPPFTVFVQHRLGFIRASYYVRTQRDAEHRALHFRLVHEPEHPSAIRDAWGELRVTPYGRDQSVVSLAILADLGDGLVFDVIRDNIQTWMLRVPELIKRHVERSVRAAPR